MPITPTTRNARVVVTFTTHDGGRGRAEFTIEFYDDDSLLTRARQCFLAAAHAQRLAPDDLHLIATEIPPAPPVIATLAPGATLTITAGEADSTHFTKADLDAIATLLLDNRDNPPPP